MIGFITHRQCLLPTQKRQDPVSYIGKKDPDLSRQSPINLYTVSIHFFISSQLTTNTAGGPFYARNEDSAGTFNFLENILHTRWELYPIRRW